MCSEEDPDHCHRHHLIAQTPLQMGVEFLHIRKAGSTETARRIERPQQLSLF